MVYVLKIMPINGYKSENKFRPDLTFADRASGYFFNIALPKKLTPGISTMNPFENEEVQRVVNEFFKKYFEDNNSRVIILGINQGRFGGGVTGIPFTDPVALEKYCGIGNTLKQYRTRFMSGYLDEYIRICGE